MQEILSRIRRMGFLVVVGICVIIYIGLGFVYMQQGPQQKDLEERIMKTMVVVNKPLPSIEELQDKYDKVNKALEPKETPKALAKIVDIARESGIDVSPESGKFHISPPGRPSAKKMGERTYQVLSFGDVRAQADFDTIMDFLSDIDSGATLETMILRRVEFKWVQMQLEAEEVARRAEFSAVIQAVSSMMKDNSLDEIPNPTYFEDGIALNDMTAFPDAVTKAGEKGYTGGGVPRDGYLLYEHDRVTADNTSDYQGISYIGNPVTEYYYTCEADGTVRQFDGPEVEAAEEFFGSEEAVYEIAARLVIDLYSRRPEG
jgi:hypothetical protein